MKGNVESSNEPISPLSPALPCHYPAAPYPVPFIVCHALLNPNFCAQLFLCLRRVHFFIAIVGSLLLLRGDDNFSIGVQGEREIGCRDLNPSNRRGRYNCKTLHENSISGASDVPYLGLPWFKFRMSCSKKDHLVLRKTWYRMEGRRVNKKRTKEDGESIVYYRTMFEFFFEG